MQHTEKIHYMIFLLLKNKHKSFYKAPPPLMVRPLKKSIYGGSP